MITVRRNDERGLSKFNWLDSRHTFSFAEYYDPKYMGFSDLRVINEDRVTPGAGFGTHSHRDMEIITYVLEGALAHQDSTGASLPLQAGEVQRMSAGTGISHSEYNASRTEPVHFLQIWIVPEKTGLSPGYEQRSFDPRSGEWVLIAAGEPRERSLKIHQDAELYLAALSPSARLSYRLKPGRQAWVQITRGTAALNGSSLSGGDGAAVSKEDLLEFEPAGDAEILLFDLR
jgi:redox-sensitive bicupin YhaK (pirin superfamily)